MIRVLCDCRMADWSGIGRYTRGLVRALAATGEVRVVQVVRHGVEPPMPSAEALCAEHHPFSLRGGRELATAVRESRPQLTHCLHFPTPIPATHPLVVTLHDLTPLVIPGAMPSPFARAAYRWWNRRAARVADAITVNSANTGADVARFFPSAEGRIRVVPHAVDAFVLEPAGELPAALGELRERPYLLSMGNTKAHKDLPTLLRAFARVAPDRPDLLLALVGPDEDGFARSVLGDDPAAGRVRFTGAVDDDTLRALYAHAAAFVFPSRYEGFGLPPLEAMALGTPTVVSDAASLPEVVGDAGLVFPAGDDAALAARLRDVLGDPVLRERLVSAGRERVRAFSWERVADGTIAVYREVLG